MASLRSHATFVIYMQVYIAGKLVNELSILSKEITSSPDIQSTGKAFVPKYREIDFVLDGDF